MKDYKVEKENLSKSQFMDSYRKYTGLFDAPLPHVEYRSEIDALMKIGSDSLTPDQRGELYTFGLKQLQFAKEHAVSENVVNLVGHALEIIEHSKAYDFITGAVIDNYMRAILHKKQEAGLIDEFHEIINKGIEHNLKR